MLSSTSYGFYDKMSIIMDKSKFAKWLNEAMKEKGILTQTELGLRAGISKQSVSNIINGQSDPLVETLEGIARGLKVPPEKVFREAGALTPISPDDEKLEEITYIFNRLTDTGKESALRFFKFLLNDPEMSK